MGKLDRFPEFPICLSIELICSDEDSSVLFAGAEDNAVCGDSLIGLNFDDVADFYLAAENFPPSRFLY